MPTFHEYEGNRAMIREEGERFAAECECGWTSGEYDSREGAVVKFEEHVEADPKHKIDEGAGGKNYTSVFIGILFLVYAISPGVIPYSIKIVGWLDNLIALILGGVLLKGGLNGKSPTRVFRDL